MKSLHLFTKEMFNTPAYDATQEINDTITPKLQSGNPGDYEEAIVALDAMKTGGRIQDYAENLDAKTVAITLNNGNVITIANCIKVVKTDGTTEPDEDPEITGDFATFDELATYMMGHNSGSLTTDLSADEYLYDVEIANSLKDEYKKGDKWKTVKKEDIIAAYKVAYDAAHPADDEQDDGQDDTPTTSTGRGRGRYGGTRPGGSGRPGNNGRPGQTGRPGNNGRPSGAGARRPHGSTGGSRGRH